MPSSEHDRFWGEFMAGEGFVVIYQTQSPDALAFVHHLAYPSICVTMFNQSLATNAEWCNAAINYIDSERRTYW